MAIDFRQFAPGRVLDLTACVAVFEALDQAYLDREIARHPGGTIIMQDSAGHLMGYVPQRGPYR